MKRVKIDVLSEARAGHRVIDVFFDYEGREELRKVIVAIESGLRSEFPGVLVYRSQAASQLFEGAEKRNRRS